MQPLISIKCDYFSITRYFCSLPAVFFPLLAALIEKEEVQKLAAQVEYMRIVHMERNNRHIKPKPGGYFTQAMQLHSSVNKTHGTQTGKSATQQSHSGVSEDAPSGHSVSNCG